MAPELCLYPGLIFSALHHGLNYFHIRNGIFQRRRNIRVIQYRLGKQVPLNRVLVTYGEADFLGLIQDLATHPAGLIRRGIKRDFNFDAAPGAEYVYPLIRRRFQRYS